MMVQFITPEKIFFSGEALMVIVPGMLGEFGVLPGHAPFISTLKPGIVRIDMGGEQKRVAVLSGIAEVSPERVTILAESAEDCSAASDSSAQARLSEARKAMDEAITDAQKKEASHRLAIAEAIAEGLKAA